FPCKCKADTCRNTTGRAEFSIDHVNEHYQRTFMRMRAIERLSYEPISLLGDDLMSMLSARRNNGGERRVNIARTLKLTDNALFYIYTAFRHALGDLLAVKYLSMHIPRRMRVPLLKMLGVVQEGNKFLTKDKGVSRCGWRSQARLLKLLRSLERRRVTTPICSGSFRAKQE
ncbi:hypothetical protein PFISCL1PPCAC_21612, partial [Pristionchus fissidentatus]